MAFAKPKWKCGYLAQKSGDLFGLPIVGKILPELEAPIRKLLSESPYAWSETPFKPIGGFSFMKGISGGNANSYSAGVREALRLVMGKHDFETRYVGKDVTAEEYSDPRGSNIFARPLIIYGRVERFGINESDVNTHEDGPYAVLPFGETIYSVEALGIFPPVISEDGPVYLRLPFDYIERWALSYVQFFHAMARRGLVPDKGRRGELFLAKIKLALSDGSETALKKLLLIYEEEFEARTGK